MTMQTYTLPIDNSPDIQFEGELLGTATTARYNYHDPHQLEPNQRWTELALYRTSSGKYVCHQSANTNKTGEHCFYNGKVCDTEEDVFEFFGNRWLAKSLYQDAGLDYVVVID